LIAKLVLLQSLEMLFCSHVATLGVAEVCFVFLYKGDAKSSKNHRYCHRQGGIMIMTSHDAEALFFLFCALFQYQRKAQKCDTLTKT